MANGKKTFYIEINGIQESVSAVDSLNKQLDALEKRIDTLKSKNINISASGGGNAKALDEEAKLLQQIEQLHQKVRDTEKEEYQELLNAKQELKEYQTIAKSIAAQENLKSGINNTNTMMGAKAQLRDLKAAMQTVDMNGDQFKKWAAEANELTQKLKEAEASYGTFSRNVGNYAEGAYEGIKKFSIEVGGVTKEFESAKKALKELKAEMQTLQYKQDKGIITEEETERFKSLVPVVRQLESAIQDAGKPLDNMLDTMQSLVAIASVGQGLSALFGIDDSEIEKTIQKLVALQNVLQGLQTIQNQITSKQGIGLFLSKGSGAIDSLTKSIFGVTAASKNATIAVKLFSGALKGIGFGLVIAGISTLIDIVGKWITKQQEAKKAAEELRKETNKNNASLETTRLEMQNTLSTLEKFNGSKKEEERIVKDLNSKYGQALGTYKTIAQWKDALKKKTDAYIESLELEFEMQQAIKKMEDAYLKKKEVDQSDASDHWSWWNPFSWGNGAQNKKVAQAEADKAYNDAKEVVTNLKKKMDEHNKKNQINLYSPQDEKETKKKIKDDSKKIEDAVRQAENNINDLKLKLMREGLHKELAQLDENNRREIEKIRKNGQKVEEQLKLQQQNYNRERQKILDQYRSETDKILSENRITETNTQIKELENELDSLRKKIDITFNKPVGTMDELEKDLASFGSSIEEYQRFVKAIGDIREERRQKYGKGFFNEVEQPDENNFLPSPDAIDEAGKEATKELEIVFDKIKEKVGERYAELFRVYSKYGGLLDIISENGDEKEYAVRLNTSFQTRTEITRVALKELYDLYREYYKQRADLQIKNIDEEEKRLTEDLDTKLEKLKTENETLLAENKNIFKELNPNGTGNTYNEKYINNDEIYRANLERIKAYEEERNGIVRKYEAERVSIENSKNEELSKLNDEWFSQRLKDYDEYLAKLGNAMSTQPVTGKTGFINISATKENLKEAEDLIAEMRKSVINDITLVQDQFSQGLISSEDKNRIISNLNEILDELDFATGNIKEKYKKLFPELAKQINDVLQIIGQAATSVIQSIGEINQAAFEKEMEALEKRSEYYEDLLDKQKTLTQKYADDVNSIEDELSTARGDRRQHLIDQLNAQMQAQRESLAQEKQIEKEQKKIDDRKKKLDYDNEMRKWNQSKLTAKINAALAITAAAVNSWPIPAVPMIAAATAMGIAQLAAIYANKPQKYADGGLLEGRSHAQGGIKVLGGHAEVEGGEFVTNKRTTAQNSDLLYYINSKKKKLDLSDMIEFYSSKPKKSISGMKRMFADGGELPTLRTDISLNSRLVDTMEKYSERPVQVEVVEIMNKTEDVRRTQVLAGLS